MVQPTVPSVQNGFKGLTEASFRRRVFAHPCLVAINTHPRASDHGHNRHLAFAVPPFAWHFPIHP